MKSRTLIFAAAAIALAAPVAAWNGRGHMIVAAEAWAHLTPRTRADIGRLLRHNPMYATWIAGVPAANRDRVAFIQAATWPDDIKGASAGYTQDRVTGPNARRNTGYDDCNRHGYWHYKDLPFSPDGTPLQAAPAPNAETQIGLFAATLGNAGASDELKSYDLVWLEHLTGDVHQPLHATSRYVATHPGGDGGGNDVLVCAAAGCKGSPLHSLWDHALGDSENVASVIAFAASLPDPDPAAAAILSPAVWLGESFDLARTQVYQPPIGGTLGPFTLTAAYRSNAAAIAARRVALAGVRLANLIENAHLRVRGDPVRPHRCPGPAAHR